MGKKVLVVDDEPACTLFLGTFLGDEGYEVQTSATGTGAISIAKEFAPDILISDWMLKDEKNGLDVAQEILEFAPNMAVIFITGMAADALEGKLGSVRPHKIIEKPIDLDDILAVVRSLD